MLTSAMRFILLIVPPDTALLAADTIAGRRDRVRYFVSRPRNGHPIIYVRDRLITCTSVDSVSSTREMTD
ncbi:hypothetical protein BgiMline_005042 [Biomphalaria glabrata]|nr:hypothetical protein BgiMline_003133 [Biomphalaria glabrata]